MKENKNNYYSFPAEWEKHDAIWLSWDVSGSGILEKQNMALRIIEALTPYVSLKVVVSSKEHRSKILSSLPTKNTNIANIEFVYHPLPYFWIRDPGPLFLKNNADELRILQFKWTYYDYHKVMEEIKDPTLFPSSTKIIGDYGRYFANQMKIQEQHSNLVAEGGALECNGDGILMVVKNHMKSRNPDWQIDDIEKELKSVLGQKKVIWLERSPIEDLFMKRPIADNFIGGGANGHIDEFCRFASQDTILLEEITVQESRQNQINEADYEILEENYQLLKKQSDLSGTPFQIIRLPKPDMDSLSIAITLQKKFDLDTYKPYGFKKGDKIRKLKCASYLNFLVTNDCVLIPNYYQEGRPKIMKEKDKYVYDVFSNLYPDRKIIPLDASGINIYGGGIHCATQQQPHT